MTTETKPKVLSDKDRLDWLLAQFQSYDLKMDGSACYRFLNFTLNRFRGRSPLEVIDKAVLEEQQLQTPVRLSDKHQH